MAGSEELYRVSQMMQAPGANRNILNMAQSGSQQMRGDILQQGDIDASGIRERGNIMAQLPAQAMDSYERGKGYGRAEETHQTKQAESQQRMTESDQRMTEAKSRMEQARDMGGRQQAVHDFEYGSEEGAPSRMDQRFDLEKLQTEQQGEMNQANISNIRTQTEMAQTQQAQQVRDREIKDMTMLYMKAGTNQSARSQLNQQLAQAGRSQQDMQMAEYTAQRELAAGNSATDMAFNSTQEGIQANGEVTALTKKTMQVEGLIRDAEQFKHADFTDPAAKSSLATFTKTLDDVNMGPQADSIRGELFNLVGGGGRFRQDRMDNAIDMLISDLTNETQVASQRLSASPSPALQRRLQKTQQMVQRLSQMRRNGGLNQGQLNPNAPAQQNGVINAGFIGGQNGGFNGPMLQGNFRARAKGGQNPPSAASGGYSGGW